MRIIKIVSQHRRDLFIDLECEGCGSIFLKESGYDDCKFHREILPNKKCESCGKSSNDLGIDYRPLETKYPDWMEI